MDPVDFRNATFADLQGRLTALRATVLDAWLKYGPGTTAELADKSGLSILLVRPRTTELTELGFVCLAGDKQGREGVYRARTPVEVVAWFAEQKRSSLTTAPQAELPNLTLPTRRNFG